MKNLKNILVTMLIVMVASLVAMANQLDKAPDLSGTWLLDSGGTTLVITQVGQEIKITETRTPRNPTIFNNPLRWKQKRTFKKIS